MSNKLQLYNLPVLSFFSGGGFLDMGFASAGFDIVWTNEIDQVFSGFYREGITAWKQKKGILKKGIECAISSKNSIKDIQSEIILKEAFKEKPSPFGIIGGPPCQDFSVNGNLNGFKGDRGSLTDAYLYKVRELQPVFFVMENVTGLIKVQKNAKHFFELLKVMKDDFLIDWEVLNSLDFGVPQSRERIFVVGINKSKLNVSFFENKSSWFPFGKYATHSGAQALYKWPEPNTFGTTPAQPSDIPITLCVESCLVNEDQEGVIANAKEYFKLHGDKRRLRSIKEGETNRPSFKRLHRYKYSPTACYGNNEVHLHPYQHRRLSVREALRIQGVDDSYVITTPGFLSKKFKMIGNGVPVPMAEALGMSVRDFIKELPLK